MPKPEPVPVQPIFLRQLRLRCGDWSVRSLRVNRHLQPFDRMTPHKHAHGQLLLYLRGSGEQRVGTVPYAVRPGAIFFIPPGRRHEFVEKAPRRAICLVADLSGVAVKRQGFLQGWLSAEALASVRKQVALLAAEQERARDLAAGGAALLIIDACLRQCTGVSTPALGADVLKRLQRAWEAVPGKPRPRPAELARRAGFQKDYLNRLVRRACGLTLGQWRDRELLRAAEAALRKGQKVTAVAETLGFSDSSYFARWFRKQIGLSPMHWLGRRLRKESV